MEIFRGVSSFATKDHPEKVNQYYPGVPWDEYIEAMVPDVLNSAGRFVGGSLGRLAHGLDSVKRFTDKHPKGSKVGLGVAMAGLVLTIFSEPVVQSAGNILGAPYRMWNDSIISPWAASVRAKLAGERSLDKGEIIYPSITIVPGADPVDKVRIRRFPSTYLKNAARVEVLGQIRIGEQVSNVVMVEGVSPEGVLPGMWAAFPCENAGGAIWDSKYIREIAEGKTICAVSGYYVRETPGLPKTQDGTVVPAPTQVSPVSK